MVSKALTVSFQGIEPLKVTVEVHFSAGLPSFKIVGLPDKAVTESGERVRAALHSLGAILPGKRVTVNLSPADVVKEGAHFDLPIAMALLGALNMVPAQELSNYVFMGELGLDGRLIPTSGILPASMAATQWSLGFVCPEEQGAEALWSGNPSILAASSLVALMNHFSGDTVIAPPEPKPRPAPTSSLDLKDVRGQDTAKRALEIAAAGGHNFLMIGPPGSGKSMLASRMVGILPPMTASEILEVSTIYSVAGLIKDGTLMSIRPFRSPHHSASMPALIGGGTKALPGDVSLAHNGVLFLDELPEFSKQALEALRQPLETGEVSISRVNGHVTYPARFQLIAAMNPCRCGYAGMPGLQCSKAPRCAEEYQNKISGPLYDRIDLCVSVPPVLPTDLLKKPEGESSSQVAARVQAAMERAAERYKDLKIYKNAQASGSLLEKICPLSPAAAALLEKSIETLRLSARSYHRVLRVARTIADLAQSEQIKDEYILEALSFRHHRKVS